jgi:hypothetical protein
MDRLHLRKSSDLQVNTSKSFNKKALALCGGFFILVYLVSLFSNLKYNFIGFKPNLKNRKKAIDEYMYGPLDPNQPNEEYWTEIAQEWNMDDIEQAKSARCGNCAAFDITQEMQDCIAKGIGSEPGSDPTSTIDAGTLGYCKFLKFKCAAKRTCSAWVEGGPIQ